MKKMKKISSSLIAVAILSSMIAPNSFAASPNETQKLPLPQQETSQQQLDETYFYENSSLYNQYIVFNSQQQKYALTDDAKLKLDSEVLEALENQLIQTNSFIKETVINNSENDEIVFSNPQQPQLTETLNNTGIVTMATKYKEGVNKIVYHWWGTSVYVSKKTINNIGTGVTIGGIWMPASLLKPVVATLGVVLGKLPGGIIFDRVYVSPLPFNYVRYQ